LTQTPSKLPEDSSKLPFGHVFTDHMLTINWSHGNWSKPNIEPLKHFSIHPAAKVLHYAIELFEGMKAYRGVDGKVRLFRPDLNMSRMHRSTHRSALPVSILLSILFSNSYIIIGLLI
jgi:branched-chain amino acid aminotransferase